MPTPGEMSDYPQRNRIVINLEDPQKGSKGQRPAQGGFGASPRKKSRIWKILGVLAGLVLVVIFAAAAGGYLWWQNYKSKPAYSLALVVDAVQRNDMKAFDSMVDTDKIVDNLVPQVTDKASANYASMLPSAVRRQVETVLPSVLPGIKQRVHDQVAAQVKELSASAQGKPFVLVAIGLPWVVDVTQTGDAAKVSLKLRDRSVELTMQKNADLWRIVGVKDDQLTQRILESAAKDSPVVSPPINNNPKDTRKKSAAGQQRIQLPQVTIPGAKP
jgi:hypothetical protein